MAGNGVRPESYSQEQLDELRAARKAGPADSEAKAVAVARDELRGDLDACEARLAQSFERAAAADALAETKRILSELHYVRTLLRDVDRELGATWNG